LAEILCITQLLLQGGHEGLQRGKAVPLFGAHILQAEAPHRWVIWAAAALLPGGDKERSVDSGIVEHVHRTSDVEMRDRETGGSTVPFADWCLERSSAVLLDISKLQSRDRDFCRTAVRQKSGSPVAPH
jgi:hypothetical protein